MSRISLHRPRLSRTASRRPAPDTRLLPGRRNPHPILHPNTHNKRCPKAQRLGLRSDQSPPRSPSKEGPRTNHGIPLLGEPARSSAPLIRRNGFAPSGDAREHAHTLAPSGHSALLRFPRRFHRQAPELTGPRSLTPRGARALPVVETAPGESFSRLVHVLSDMGL